MNFIIFNFIISKLMFNFSEILQKIINNKILNNKKFYILYMHMYKIYLSAGNTIKVG